MIFTVSPIESKSKWETFIGSQNPNTFLHSWNWGQFHEKLGCKIFRLGIQAGRDLIGVALFIKIPARRGTFLFCPHGPILKPSLQKIFKEVLKTLLATVHRIAKEEQCSFIRISPLMKASEENETLFLNLGFRNAPTHMHPELSWLLDIAPTEEQLLANMRKTTRYSIRKAQRDGVVIQTRSDLDGVDPFCVMYEETVDRQNFTPFSKNYLKTEFKVFQKDRQAMWLFGKYNNEIISGAMVIFYQNIAFYHHGASIQKYAKVPASYLLQWEAIREARQRGCVRYNFWGIAPENAPNHPWTGITLFKKGFGGYAEAYIHSKDYILSPRYWLTYGIEKVRRFKRGL